MSLRSSRRHGPVCSTVLASADAVKHTASAFVDRSETSFPRAQIPPAALGLQSARQHATGRSVVRELPWLRREASRRAEVARAARLVLRLVDAQGPPVEVVAVEPLNGGGGGGALDELHEGEPSRAAGGTIARKEDAGHSADLPEQCLELSLRRLEAQVSHEQPRFYDLLLSRVIEPTIARLRYPCK